MLRVLLGTCQLVETQDQWDQKIQHTLQRRNFVVAVQLLEDRTAESRVEGLLTLILEDRSKNIIKDCRVEACLAVGFLAPAHSILIRLGIRDGMLSKPSMRDGKSYTLCQNRQDK